MVVVGWGRIGQVAVADGVEVLLFPAQWHNNMFALSFESGFYNYPLSQGEEARLERLRGENRARVRSLEGEARELRQMQK